MRFSLRSIALLTSVVVAVACSDDPASTSASSSSGSSGTPAPANPKFVADVMPILSNSCALSSCHASKEAPAGVNITTDKDVTYKALVNADSKNFGATKLVVPGKPEDSLVMAKMDGTQNELTTCPKTSTGCGKSMPPPEDEGEQLLSKKKRDTIRNWITNGAKND